MWVLIFHIKWGKSLYFSVVKFDLYGKCIQGNSLITTKNLTKCGIVIIFPFYCNALCKTEYVLTFASGA